MKKIVVLCGLVAWFGLAAWSQTPAPAAPAPATGAKIGIIHIQRAIVDSTEGKKAAEDLSKRFTPKRNDLQKKQDELARLQKQLEDGKNTLSDETRANLVREIERKNKDLTRETEDANSDFQLAESQLINTIGAKVMRVIDEYARRNGYDVILDVSSPQTNVLWATNRIDITDEIIAEYNKTGAAPAPAGTGTAAPPSGTAPAPRPATPAGAGGQKPPAPKPTAPPK